ncbi:P-loop ATPase protein family protein [Candidatus Electrothrix aarhusensis]|uniref:P-loop ATPase protein family protein n=1 Tax=Candidatus Electrothrix aarhusensis TaxID=1859131 RepID=A0A3S3QI26_9BACT|nr:P-loop ATPase protein family protein [Candidatus Electrothrix aarhusensis]
MDILRLTSFGMFVFSLTPIVDDLREYTGLEKQISAYALDNATGQEFIEHFSSLVSFTMSKHKAGGREELRCAIGCTGGRHRSVAVTEYLRNALSECLDSEDELIVYHRDIEKR